MKKNSLIPKNLYKKIHEAMPIACVDIVIISDNKFLLVKRKNKPAQGLWWLPGGRILRNETIQDTVTRKAKEETGLKVKIVKCLGVDETIFPDGPFGSSTHTINVVFLVKPLSPVMNIKLDEQSDESKWFSKIEKNWHPYVKKFLKLS